MNPLKMWVTQFVNAAIAIIRIARRSSLRLRLSVADARDESDACVILGNGPSLRGGLPSYLEQLQTRDVFVVNSFAVSEFFERVRPRYYLLADEIYWTDTLIAERDRVFNALAARTAWPLVLFIPSAAKRCGLVEAAIAGNPHITVAYFNATPLDDAPQPLLFYCYRHNLAMPTLQNALVGSIYLALNLGYRKSVLLGADHSWHEHLSVSDTNVLCMDDTYNAFATGTKVSPVLHPSGQRFSIDGLFFALATMFKAHRILQEYACHLGARVYNATEHSYIDAYPRVKAGSIGDV
jgi:hypothetical protein